MKGTKRDRDNNSDDGRVPKSRKLHPTTISAPTTSVSFSKPINLTQSIPFSIAKGSVRPPRQLRKLTTRSRSQSLSSPTTFTFELAITTHSSRSHSRSQPVVVLSLDDPLSTSTRSSRKTANANSNRSQSASHKKTVSTSKVPARSRPLGTKDQQQQQILVEDAPKTWGSVSKRLPHDSSRLSVPSSALSGGRKSKRSLSVSQEDEGSPHFEVAIECPEQRHERQGLHKKRRVGSVEPLPMIVLSPDNDVNEHIHDSKGISVIDITNELISAHSSSPPVSLDVNLDVARSSTPRLRRRRSLSIRIPASPKISLSPLPSPLPRKNSSLSISGLLLPPSPASSDTDLAEQMMKLGTNEFKIEDTGVVNDTYESDDPLDVLEFEQLIPVERKGRKMLRLDESEDELAIQYKGNRKSRLL